MGISRLVHDVLMTIMMMIIIIIFLPSVSRIPRGLELIGRILSE